jgi:hypothetical protein
MTCDAYKAGGAVPTMQVVDAMTPEWRVLIHKYGLDDVWDLRRNNVEYARSVLEKCYGRH